MRSEEIQELLDLKGWSRCKLAAELGMTESTVHYWLNGRRNPSGAAAVLMKIWLEEARKKLAPAS